jgi:hypothetical protein
MTDICARLAETASLFAWISVATLKSDNSSSFNLDQKSQ